MNRRMLWFVTLALAPSLLAQARLAQEKKPAAPTSLRLYLFDCGTLDNPDPKVAEPYQLKKEELVTPKMSVECFLIAHPKGNMIWDAGAVPESAFKNDGKPAMVRYATARKPFRAQLAEVGYTPTDIQYFALSHFHWDHVGNANLFAGATWLVQKSDRDVMFGDPPSPRTEPQNFSALKNSKTTYITTNDYDVFGDGAVVIKATPGHSPGHQSLFVKLAKTGPVVISGDLYHYPEERSLNRVPTTEFNPQQTVASRASLEAFLKKTGAQLWIQHDYTADAKRKSAPSF